MSNFEIEPVENSCGGRSGNYCCRLRAKQLEVGQAGLRHSPEWDMRECWQRLKRVIVIVITAGSRVAVKAASAVNGRA